MIRILPFLFGSFIIHTSLVICLEYVNLWPPQAGGSLQGNLDKVFVSVISDEDFTACALSPATRESAASTPLPASPMRQDESTDEPKKDRNISPEPQLLHNVPSHPVLSEEATNAEIVKEPEKGLEHKQEMEEKPKEQQKVEDTQPGAPSPASTPQIASETSVSREAMGADLHDFKSTVLSAIGKALYYPSKAYRKKHHGQSTVAFSISKDGSLEELQLITSSGSKYLDEAAEKIIRKASKEFPPIPKGFQKDSIRYVLPIIFKKERAQKR